MSMTVASGIFTAILGITTLSYTQNGFMAAGVGAGGAWVTSQCYKKEQEQAERFFSAYPYGGQPATPAQTQQAQQVTASPTAEAHPTAFATASVGDTQITVQMEAPTYPYAQPPIAPPTAPTAAPNAATGVSRWDEPVHKLPTIDVTQQLARESTALLAAPRNSGKTTTIYSAIRHRYEWQRGNVKFMIADPKGSHYLGLSDTDDYAFIEFGEAEKFLRFLEVAATELRTRIRTRRRKGDTESLPLFTVIIDEWITIRETLKAFDSENRTKLLAKAEGILNYIATTGREDRVNLWMITHSTACSDNGLSGQLRGNLGVYALGRKAPGEEAALENITSTIGNPAILDDAEKRRQLKDMVRNLDPGPTPVLFTSRSGGTLAQLPDLSSFVDWQYPVPQAKTFDPFEVSLGELKEVLSRIDACQSKAEMSQTFGITKGGTPKWQELARWYDLVKTHGVDEAMAAIASSQDEADEDEAA